MNRIHIVGLVSLYMIGPAVSIYDVVVFCAMFCACECRRLARIEMRPVNIDSVDI